MSKKKLDPRIVKSLSQLKLLAEDKMFECYILLAGGLVRSSKEIYFDTDNLKFHVHNDVDNTDQTLTSKQIMDKSYTNIGEAIKRKALIAY